MSMHNKYTISADIYSILMDTYKKKKIFWNMVCHHTFAYAGVRWCIHSLYTLAKSLSSIVPTLSVHGDHF